MAFQIGLRYQNLNRNFASLSNISVQVWLKSIYPFRGYSAKKKVFSTFFDLISSYACLNDVHASFVKFNLLVQEISWVQEVGRRRQHDSHRNQNAPLTFGGGIMKGLKNMSTTGNMYLWDIITIQKSSKRNIYGPCLVPLLSTSLMSTRSHFIFPLYMYIRGRVNK